jgi:hypothetical protein
MKTGRPPEEESSREKVVCVRFTADEVKGIDAARGKRNRSEFVRETMRKASASK